MSEDKYKDVILETIDSLRKRKARPDMERICHMVERKHSRTFAETEADLEKLVKSGIVIKVDYKGSTSYRNAAKWRKSHIGGGVSNSNDTARRVQSVVSALLREALPPPGPGAADTGEEARIISPGVAYADIEKLLQEDGGEETSPISSTTIQAILSKEVDTGRLKVLPSGNYILGRPKATSPSVKSGPPSDNNTAARQSSGSPTKKGRPPGVKRKLKHCNKSPKDQKEPKLKKPLLSVGSTEDLSYNSGHDTTPEPIHDDHDDLPADLSDAADKEVAMASPSTSATSASGGVSSVAGQSQPASAGRTSVASSVGGGGEGMAYIVETGSKCDYCLLTSECNRVGRPEDLLYCKDCQAKAHPSCMDYSEDLAKRARNSPWQCIDCKTCYVCEDAGDPDAMLFCDACDKGYHMNCHHPKVLDKPTGKWVCSKCVIELGLSNEESLDQASEQDISQSSGNGSSENNNTISVNKNTGPKTDGGGASCLPTPNDSPVYFQDLHDPRVDRTNHNSHDIKDHHRPSLMLKISNRHTMPSLPRLSETLPAVVPDASEWSINEVVQFFRNVGFVDQAEVFREQEIDGRSLLLMRRSDVLTGLSLKLGPALKIYTHVQRLQMRCDTTL